MKWFDSPRVCFSVSIRYIERSRISLTQQESMSQLQHRTMLSLHIEGTTQNYAQFTYRRNTQNYAQFTYRRYNIELCSVYISKVRHRTMLKVIQKVEYRPICQSFYCILQRQNSRVELPEVLSEYAVQTSQNNKYAYLIRYNISS